MEDEHDWITVQLSHGVIKYYINDKKQMIFTAEIDPGYELRMIKNDDPVPDGWEVVLINDNVIA